MSLESLFANSLPTVPRSRAILSRFATPLAKRNKNIEIAVELQDPWKSYCPGELVKGDVVVTVTKGFDVTHLVVCLRGYAKVYANQVTPGEGTRTTDLEESGRGSQGVEHHGNGFISLFQDEVPLCGSGFLKKQIYKFGFELVFPDEGLPSSIDFERGAVSYFITATLTRPTTIAPLITYSRKIWYQDCIDIAGMPVPKARIVSLEPITKRGKVKARAKHRSPEQVSQSLPQNGIARLNDTNSTSPSPQLSGPEPRPPSRAPSEISAASAVSTSTHSFEVVNRSSSSNGSSTKNSDARSSTISGSAHTISVASKLLRPGALPGDTVPIQICISHSKPSVRGFVIVTLYRQGRIDMHPDLPLASKNGRHTPEYEDIYPRSRTGLGGLHFSNTPPCSVHRKDLAQTSTMMVMDPNTMAAEVRTSIRVPEDAFPTMTNVPGEMISFKYFIEVVIDVFGKLGESRFLPRLTSQPMAPEFNGADRVNQITTQWSNNILDTVQLRRTKNVVDCLFSLTVGTRDSARRASGWRGSGRQNDRSMDGRKGYANNSEGHEYDHSWSQGSQNHDFQFGYYDGSDDWSGHDPNGPIGRENSPPLTHSIPPPNPEDESIDEKERMRRYEQLLLPSRPPDPDQPSSAAVDLVPSAPCLRDDEGIYHYPSPLDAGAGPSRAHVVTLAVSARSVDTIVPVTGLCSYLPAFDSTLEPPLEEDKRELGRLQLLAQASAPPCDGDEGRQSVHNAAPHLTATAPVLNEEDEYNAHTLADEHLGEDHLPQYRR